MQMENELWDFALDFYQKPGVEEACLYLQDHYGLSINRMIFSCWCGLQGIETYDELYTGSAEKWQREVTHPLRVLRYKVRDNKNEYSSCYKKLREAELACEQVELALLNESLSSFPKNSTKNSGLIEKNLRTYLKLQNLPIDKELTHYLSKLIGVLEHHYVAK